MFKWHHGPSEAEDNIGILSKNQRERVISGRPAEPQDLQTCSNTKHEGMFEVKVAEARCEALMQKSCTLYT